MTDEFDRDLRVLLDKQAIHEVLMRWCRGVDRCDEELVRSTYHPDGWDDHGTFKGSGSDFAPWVCQQHREHSAATLHTVCNELIEIDGDDAHVESYFVAYDRVPVGDDTMVFTTGGRYVDEFARRDGAWLISRRICVYEWHHLDRVDDPQSPYFKDFVWGLRSRDDVAYYGRG